MTTVVAKHDMVEEHQKSFFSRKFHYGIPLVVCYCSSFREWNLSRWENQEMRLETARTRFLKDILYHISISKIEDKGNLIRDIR